MAKEETEKGLTIFDAIGIKERQEAIKNLIRGKTPIAEVRKRSMRGGGEANYVNTYYMTRQISLLTGFRWKSECLEERILENEIGAKMKVIIWDNNDREFSHESWGQKDIARYANTSYKQDKKGNIIKDDEGKPIIIHKIGDPISIFDDLKAAYSDGIKKILSYFGIANDIYGGKELEFFASDDSEGGEQETGIVSGNEAYKAFGKFLNQKHIPVSKALEILKVGKLSEIADYKVAHDTLVKELGK